MIRSLLLQWLYLRDEIIYQILICYLLIWRKLIKDKVHWINFRSFNLKRTLLFVDMHLIFSTMKVKENYLSPAKLLQNLKYLKSLLCLDKSPSKMRCELVINNTTFGKIWIYWDLQLRISDVFPSLLLSFKISVMHRLWLCDPRFVDLCKKTKSILKTPISSEWASQSYIYSCHIAEYPRIILYYQAVNHLSYYQENYEISYCNYKKKLLLNNLSP